MKPFSIRVHSRSSTAKILILALAIMSAKAAELPARYFQLIEAGAHQVEARLTAEPTADLELLEKTPGWTHFSNTQNGFCFGRRGGGGGARRPVLLPQLESTHHSLMINDTPPPARSIVCARLLASPGSFGMQPCDAASPIESESLVPSIK